MGHPVVKEPGDSSIANLGIKAVSRLGNLYAGDSGLLQLALAMETSRFSYCVCMCVFSLEEECSAVGES